MTKANLIKSIQQYEANLYLELKQTERSFGRESSMAVRNRAEWGAIYELMKVLKIKPDFNLPEMEMAIQVHILTEQENKIIEQREQEDFESKDISAY